MLSSQIEGTQSSLQNLLAAEARLNDPDAPSDVGEVVNYVAAMNHGIEGLAELPVSLRLIREIHAKLMQGACGGRLTPGESRTTQNWIGPGGCTSKEATFVPPPPQEVPTAPSNLEFLLHIESPPPAPIQVGHRVMDRERGNSQRVDRRQVGCRQQPRQPPRRSRPSARNHRLRS